MKTNLKKGIFTILLVCSALIASAAQVEVVYLKNGSIIKGVIIEQIPNASLKIQTADGSIFAYQMDDIEKITKEKVSHNKTGLNMNMNLSSDNGLKKGYRGFVDFGGTIGTGDFGEGRLDISTSHGYQFNPYFFAGIGIGVNYYPNNEFVEIPFFVHFRSELLNNSISPFVDFKIGYSVYDGTGFYATPSVGCRVAINDKYGVSLGLGYTAQKLEYEWNRYSSSVNNGGFSIKASFDF